MFNRILHFWTVCTLLLRARGRGCVCWGGSLPYQMNMKDDFTRPLWSRRAGCDVQIFNYLFPIRYDLPPRFEWVMGETELATIISILQHFDYVWVRIRESVISDLWSLPGNHYTGYISKWVLARCTHAVLYIRNIVEREQTDYVRQCSSMAWLKPINGGGLGYSTYWIYPPQGIRAPYEWFISLPEWMKIDSSTERLFHRMTMDVGGNDLPLLCARNWFLPDPCFKKTVTIWAFRDLSSASPISKWPQWVIHWGLTPSFGVQLLINRQHGRAKSTENIDKGKCWYCWRWKQISRSFVLHDS